MLIDAMFFQETRLFVWHSEGEQTLVCMDEEPKGRLVNASLREDYEGKRVRDPLGLVYHDDFNAVPFYALRRRKSLSRRNVG